MLNYIILVKNICFISLLSNLLIIKVCILLLLFIKKIIYLFHIELIFEQAKNRFGTM